MSSDEPKPKESKRKQTRYAVSDDCRIRASIKIRSSDAASANKDWPGTLVDMSAGGAHIQISLGAVAYTGDSCVLQLVHAGVKLEMRGTLAHYICSSRYSMCGVKFDAFSSGWEKPYQPFFKTVVASSTLKGGPTDSDLPGRYREEYLGAGQAKLVVWRDNKPERNLLGFDFTMARYAAALASVDPDMFKNKAEVGFRSTPMDNGAPGLPLTQAQQAEARWEFSLAASNLPKAIAPDIRRLLRLVS
jgi:hypothetical protein